MLEASWTTAVIATSTGFVGTPCVTTGKGRIIVAVKGISPAGTQFSYRVIFYAGETPSSTNALGSSALISNSFVNATDNDTVPYRLSQVSAFANDVGAMSAMVYIESMPTDGNSLKILIGAF